MSSLIFATNEDEVLVATDTLAVDMNGKPDMFISKATYIQHLKIIIAGTGIGGFSNEWAYKASAKMVLSGINNLDYHTPKSLCNLWSSYTKDEPLLKSYTTTIYQFGVSEEDGNMVSFAYRSESDFESEMLEYKTAVKPQCHIPENESILSCVPSMMMEQRKIQEEQPKELRLYIGGEMNVLYLTKERCQSFSLGKFPDYEENLDEIFSKYRFKS